MKKVIEKINIDGLVKALSSANEAMSNFGNMLRTVKPEPSKKKRGAGYTKRRISKRSGKSSSH